MWILIGIVAGFVAVGVLLIAAFVTRRSGDTARLGAEMTGDQWLTLGIVFAGAGAALMAAIGVWMIGMVATGVIYMGIGIWMKRNGHGGQTDPDRYQG
jgi:hypothetical protein